MVVKFLQDAVGVLILCSVGAAGGLLLNQIRAQPLPLVYVPASQRALEPAPGGEARTIAHLSLAELERLLGRPDVLVLDARPALLYLVGHIPGALSLPKEDFPKAFGALEAQLRAPGLTQIVVYCSGDDCEDSIAVAQGLLHAGLDRVVLYDGGWEEWQATRPP